MSFKKNGSTESQGPAQTPQAAFVEEQVRLGFSIADVTMWQALCRKCSLFGEDSSFCMLVLQSISAEHGVSVMHLVSLIRGCGHKELNAAAVQQLLDQYQEAKGDDDDEEEDRTEEEADPPSSPPPLRRKKLQRRDSGHYVEVEAQESD